MLGKNPHPCLTRKDGAPNCPNFTDFSGFTNFSCFAGFICFADCTEHSGCGD